MAESTGIVNAIETKDGNFGPQVRVNVSGTWYDYGKFAPRGIKEGDTVKVTFTTNDRGYHKIERNGLVQVAAGTPSVQPYSAAMQPGGPAPKPTYVDNRQDTISKQAAANTAIAFVDLLIKHGGIKLPAKAADAYAIISGAVSQESVRFFKENTGGTWDLTEDSDKSEVGKRTASLSDDGTDDYPN